MIHDFHPRWDFHFYPFIANSLRQGNLQNRDDIGGRCIVTLPQANMQFRSEFRL